MSRAIETQAKLIESLAATIDDRMWSSDVLQRCKLIREAVAEIEKKAQSKIHNER